MDKETVQMYKKIDGLKCHVDFIGEASRYIKS